MNQSCFHAFADLPDREIAPGFHCKLVHTGSNTINFLDVIAGSSIPLHSHMHEQSSFVLEGEFEMTVNGETRVLRPGHYCVIPPHSEHGGRALTHCRLIDVFSPVREDYK